MLTLDALTTLLFALWAVSEVSINLFSLRNRIKDSSGGADRFSHLGVALTTEVPIAFAILLWINPRFMHGFGSLAPLFPLLGYLGCLVLALGITIRVAAVATLKRQFTVKVAVLKQHEIIDTGVYGIIRHPAYLGHLASLLGLGLLSENWISLLALIILPPMGILYRIRVEEAALLRSFGPAYAAYANRTKRLLPGIW